MHKKLTVLLSFLTIVLLASVVDAGSNRKKQEVQPQLHLTMPGSSQVIVGNYMTVQVFSPTTKIHQRVGKNRPKEGHLKITVDNNPSISVGRTTYRLNVAQLSEGRHALTVELVQNDGSSFVPVVKQTAEFSIVRSQLVKLSDFQKQQRRQNPQRFHPARLFSRKRV